VPYLFKPPTVEEGPAGFTRLFWRYRIARANSILIKDGIVTSVRTPAVQDTQSADYCYLGGSEYVIDCEPWSDRSGDASSAGFYPDA
jgi:hypothetical protein